MAVEGTILDNSTDDLRFVRRDNDTIVIGAMSKRGLLQLTSMVNDGIPKIDKVWKLMDGMVYMVLLSDI